MVRLPRSTGPVEIRETYTGAAMWNRIGAAIALAAVFATAPIVSARVGPFAALLGVAVFGAIRMTVRIAQVRASAREGH